MPATRTIDVPGNHPDVLAWLDAHGLEPSAYLRTVTIHHDSAITLAEIVRDDTGRPKVTGDHIVTVGRRIEPLYPFPL